MDWDSIERHDVVQSHRLDGKTDDDAKGETESVNVNLVKCEPELSKDGIYLRESRPNNLLRWDVDVAANCNGEKALPISYEFRMELDRQMAITGFLSR